ncbi:hypothetical protein [Natronolimnobius baerhuensis]|uniref:Uncharacterized protein n=1 Tax=Natronolimnobius baerhuensis TaxID=253108 RepID=A0A202EA65_9EURY|nr:hypothetical protein [Natronolimnobius baerhuensis]OVE85109.1 hypothetical protein B2G88_12245 [Natronolimnobius baerhuensis]
MNRRTLLVLAGTTGLTLAGCLESQAGEPAATTDDTDSNTTTTSNDSSNATEDDPADSSEPRSPTAVVDTFVTAVTNDDVDTARDQLHPDAPIAEDLDRDAIIAASITSHELDVLEEDEDEVVLEAVWTVTVDSSGERENAEEATVELTFRQHEQAWRLWALEDEQDTTVAMPQAALSVDIDSDAQTASITLVAVDRADDFAVTGPDTTEACDGSLEAVGDSCTVEGPGEYAVIASYATPDNEAVITTFEIDE